MTKLYSRLLTGLFFFVALVLMTVLTFPFGLLKVHLDQQLSKYVDPEAKIGSLSLGMPISVKFKDLVLPGNFDIDQAGGGDLKIKQLSIGISVLNFFIGKARVSLAIDNGADGELDLDLDLSVIDLLSGKTVPRINLFTEGFVLDSILSTFIDIYSRSAYASPLISPFLKQLSFYGSIDSKIKVSLDKDNWQSVSGEASISSPNFRFSSSDPNLEIPEQLFSVAQLSLTVNNGDFLIDKSTQFKSQQLLLGISGQLKLEQNLAQSMMKLEIPLEMRGDILEKLGVIVQMAVLRQEDWQGKALINVTGTLLAPRITSTEL